MYNYKYNIGKAHLFCSLIFKGCPTTVGPKGWPIG